MNNEARWRAMTAESRRLHDKLMPPGHYESVLERETASWFACTTYADAELPTELKVRSIEDMKQELKDALALIAVSYTHLTLPTIHVECRSRWSPYH